MIRLIPQPSEITEYGGISQSITDTVYKENENLDIEEYILSIKNSRAEIEFSAQNGRFYAEKTLEQLCGIYKNRIPDCKIQDKPSYPFRSFMTDCARHIFSLNELKKMIDLASKLKLNRFHWHLSDDQGFRAELETYPELTKYGSVRKCDNFGKHCQSDKPYGGYYTKSEIKEIVSYCKERFIEVIPEIDMPGHTSAILHCYPELGCSGKNVEVKCRQGIFKDVLCVGKDETFTFITKLLDEMCELFDGEYFHIGGDEVPDTYRKTCPYCNGKMNRYGFNTGDELRCDFINKVAEYLKSKGKRVIVWNDILKGNSLNKDITVQRWMDKKHLSSRFANGGGKIITSDFTPFYFDYPYAMHPLKSVYNHNPKQFSGLDGKGRNNIIGFEAPVWTEYINSDEKLEYMCLPRLFAFAENVWTVDKNKNYAEFKKYNRIFCNYISGSGYTVAPESDWDISLPARLSQTARFFIKAYTFKGRNKKNEKR